MHIDATELDYTALNEAVTNSDGDCEISHCPVQRFVGADAAALLESPFTVVILNSENPYKQMYVAN